MMQGRLVREAEGRGRVAGSRRWGRLMIGLFVSLLGPGSVSALALAEPLTAYGQTELISVSPMRGPAGSVVTIYGSGFGPNYSVPIGTGLSPTQLVTAHANATGSFAQNMTIPANAPPSTTEDMLRIWAVIGNGGSTSIWFFVTQTVTPPPTAPPPTAATPPATLPTQPPAAMDNAELATQSPYPTVHPGDKVHIFITPKNTGTTTWSSRTGYGYVAMDSWSYVGFHPLWQDVRPGETITFDDTVTAPESPGVYNYGFLLKHNGANIGPYFFVQVTVVPTSTIPDTVTLPVPFKTQIDSADVPGAGAMNCGPASLAMVIESFGGSISVPDAALYIRHGQNTAKGSHKNGSTSFKSAEAQALLRDTRLTKTYSLISADVTSFDQLRQELAAKHPVIILLSNWEYQFSTPQPYEGTDGGWFTTDHIVVVTGYDGTSVYINDPLRREKPPVITHPADYAVPIDTFQRAALSTKTSPGAWYAISVQKAP